MKSALYFITELDGRCRQVVNGVVTSLNKKKPILSPTNTYDIVILWERTPLHGTVRNFSLPLGFILDGAFILRNDYYKFSIDRQLNFLFKRLVCEVDATHYRLYYKQMYKGELDFSTFNDEKGESKVEINIMEGGLSKLIKAQENTKYFIPFDEDAVNVLMDGVVLHQKNNFITTNQDTIFEGNALIGISFLTSDGNAPGVAAFTVFAQVLPGDLTTSTEYFLITTQAITGLNLRGSFIYTISTPIGGLTFNVEIRTSAGNTIPLVTGITASGTASFDVTFNGSVGEKFFLCVIKTIGAGGIAFSETEITLDFNSRFPSTILKCFKIFDAYKKIVEKITGNQLDAVSTILQSSTLVLTSGDGIRGLQDSGITTSFNDIVKAADVCLFTGVQIKETVELEGRDTYFVQDSIDPAVDLGDSKDLKVTPATDLMYSSIKIGWQEQTSNDVNDLNAKSDFNGFHIYTTPIKRVSKEMDLQSPYKAGPFEIANLQLNLDGKATSGGATDNDVFVLDVVIGANPVQNVLLSFIASGNYIVFPALPKIALGTVFSILSTVNNNFTYTVTAVEDLGTTQTVHTNITITISEPVVLAQLTFVSGQVYLLDRSVVPDSGVPDVSSIFNVRLRPSELLKKHYRWIRSYLYGYDADIIEFQSSNRNSGLVIAGLTDGRDVVINAMGDRIFKPQYLEFTTKVPISLQDTLESSPNKCFAMEWIDNRFTGFLWKAGLAPNSRQPQVYKLLLTEENDQKDLIS